MTGGIFISYRRGDNRYAAGRLYDSLRQRFPGDQIFIDVDNIEPGLNFLEVISSRIAAVDAMLVIIGPHWLDAQDENGRRRLDDPSDLVRYEIETALQRGIRVIPVLVDGASMPTGDDLPSPLKPLALRNAVTVTHATFKHDVERLGKVLATVVKPRMLDNGGDQPEQVRLVASPAPSLLGKVAIWAVMLYPPSGIVAIAIFGASPSFRAHIRQKGWWETGKYAALGSALFWAGLMILSSGPLNLLKEALTFVIGA